MSSRHASNDAYTEAAVVGPSGRRWSADIKGKVMTLGRLESSPRSNVQLKYSTVGKLEGEVMVVEWGELEGTKGPTWACPCNPNPMSHSIRASDPSSHRHCDHPHALVQCEEVYVKKRSCI